MSDSLNEQVQIVKDYQREIIKKSFIILIIGLIVSFIILNIKPGVVSFLLGFSVSMLDFNMRVKSGIKQILSGGDPKKRSIANYLLRYLLMLVVLVLSFFLVELNSYIVFAGILSVRAVQILNEIIKKNKS